MTLVVEYLGWVDYDSGHSSVGLILLGQMGIWQNRLVNKAMWWNIRNLSQPNQGMRLPESPCTIFSTQLVPLPYRIYTIYLSLIWETIFARVGVGLSVRASVGKQNKLKTKHSDRPST